MLQKINCDVRKANYIILSIKKISKNSACWNIYNIFREVDLIYQEQDSDMRKTEVARLIAPKIAYQWFSNVFSLLHFWLHDGLVTLFAQEAIVKVYL